MDLLLAGFQSGMVASIALLVWLAFTAGWYRHSVWAAANIMASNFYGNDAIGRPFGWRTLSGAAVYLILYTIFGALFALALRGGMPRLRLVLLGILSGVAWYYLWFGLLWPHLNPLITLYTHDRPMLWGHMLYGGMLGRFPLYLRRLAGTPRAALVPSALPPAQASAEAAAPPELPAMPGAEPLRETEQRPVE